MRSFVNDNHMLDEENRVVSLVAKPGGKNPEHAFILVEGLTKNEAGEEQVLFRRYDFVTELPDNDDANCLEEKAQIIKKHRGIVIMKEYTCAADDKVECEDLFWSSVLKDEERTQGCQGATWSIPREKADLLHTQVGTSKKNPPDYQISGEHAFFAASSSQRGHNCYTWARSQLKQLEVSAITKDQRLGIALADFFAARTTRHLAPPVKKENPAPSSLNCSLM